MVVSRVFSLSRKVLAETAAVKRPLPCKLHEASARAAYSA
jgi:hypothetical protein